MRKLLVLLVLNLGVAASLTGQATKQIQKNEMTVTWSFDTNQINFEMSAPTEGWVTVGFNESANVKGAYLLMGRIVQGRAELVEHYTKSPGTYRPITDLGGTLQVHKVSGEQKNSTTTLRFSLPTDKATKYQKKLVKGKNYHMILAYSMDDDFQHHSRIRTSVEIQL